MWVQNNIRTNKNAIEIQEGLKKLNIISSDSKIKSYKQLQGGSDTIIFEISFQNHSREYIQRIFRNPVNRDAQFEYYVQKILFDNGINVPQPFLLKTIPNNQGLPYFIMEKIIGTRLDQELFENPERTEQLLRIYINELYKIHSIDPGLFFDNIEFMQLFPPNPIPNIEENPYIIIDQYLNKSKTLVERFPKELEELKPIIQWLEKNRNNNPCKKLVIIHGDYHPLNIIVQKDQQFQILDWCNADFSDFRIELGLSVGILPAKLNADVFPLVVDMYEKISDNKVENLPFFIILANIFNLVRFYSGMNNPKITNETEASLNLFKTIKEYPLCLVKLVKEICNIELLQIKEFLDNLK